MVCEAGCLKREGDGVTTSEKQTPEGQMQLLVVTGNVCTGTLW